MVYKKMKGQNVSLALVRPEDADKWAEWLNDPEISLPLGDEAYSFITHENQLKDIQEILEHKEHVFTIIENITENAIGRCLLFFVDRTNRSAMLGIFIGDKDYWNKGFGREATKLLLDYGFNLLNLNSIRLGVFEFNRRAINCYRDLGFQEIGRQRQARIIGNKKYDLILMDMLAEEFKESRIKKIIEP